MRGSHGSLPRDLERSFKAALDEWGRGGKLRRLLARDATLWTDSGEERWLGWLDAPLDPAATAAIDRAATLREELESEGVGQAVLLGMGGSSLCPEVLARSFGRRGFHVLDTTDPEQIRRVEAAIDPASTLFIVSSKSGTTLETDVLRKYFFERAGGKSGAAGSRFIAITDPGSTLASEARAGGYRAVFQGVPDIGGRYSALSVFGLVPGALMGIDAARLLSGAAARAAALERVGAEDPDDAVQLGAALGVAVAQGRDKITLIASPPMRPLGAWIEQLVAESTGKQGRGAIPIDGETPASADCYGDDRFFVHIRCRPDREETALVDALGAAGHPIFAIDVDDPHDLGGEFHRWEIATAVAGSILGIHPFDQPDVEASKEASRRLTAAFASSGALPPETPLVEQEGLRVFADDGLCRMFPGRAAGEAGLAGLLAAHMSRLARGDYFALLAWMTPDDSATRALQEIRHAVRATKRAATTLGFGPRYLHSTGQEHKGGPASGHFLMIAGHGERDLMVPGGPCSFGILKAAQARGDFDVLAARGRRILRVDLGSDRDKGLALLRDALRRAAVS